jgi:AMMECR1 domain-containing protein
MGKKGLLLPNLDGVDSTEKQIEIVKKKAGIDKNKSIEDLNIQFFTTTRYK